MFTLTTAHTCEFQAGEKNTLHALLRNSDSIKSICESMNYIIRHTTSQARHSSVSLPVSPVTELVCTSSPYPQPEQPMIQDYIVVEGVASRHTCILTIEGQVWSCGSGWNWNAERIALPFPVLTLNSHLSVYRIATRRRLQLGKQKPFKRIKISPVRTGWANKDGPIVLLATHLMWSHLLYSQSMNEVNLP